MSMTETDRIASYAGISAARCWARPAGAAPFNQIGRIPQHAALEMGRKLKREHPDADSILLPSPHWPTAGAIERSSANLAST